MRTIRASSIEYLTIPLTSPDDLTGVPVEVSFDGEQTWYAAEHVPEGVRVLVGPSGTSGAVTLAPGTYTVLVRVTDTPERPVLTAVGPVLVVDEAPETWATVREVARITGETVTDSDLVRAQVVVEIHCGRTYAATPGMKPRDVEWLRRAVAWQAAWLPSQHGYQARMGASAVQQDGLSTTFTSAADLTLAPLAQRSLKNCSWMGTRSLRTTTRRPRSPEGAEPTSNETWLRSSADPEHGWERM